ncbi:unnamed protein product [Spirodela intermedia]|uniref:Uncharacterized protein n=1 Tax=Spirodela intermedia TaxID=51605 RepID=A0A7I8KTP6_SPIIN|nr:unnamed protein product [Spirodela intermedia]
MQKTSSIEIKATPSPVISNDARRSFLLLLRRCLGRCSAPDVVEQGRRRTGPQRSSFPAKLELGKLANCLSEGTGPLKLLFATLKTDKKFRRISARGMGPDRRLPERFSVSKSERSESFSGISPEKLFTLRSSMTSLLSWPISGGIVPLRLLFPRFNDGGRLETWLYCNLDVLSPRCLKRGSSR